MRRQTCLPYTLHLICTVYTYMYVCMYVHVQVREYNPDDPPNPNFPEEDNEDEETGLLGSCIGKIRKRRRSEVQEGDDNEEEGDKGSSSSAESVLQKKLNKLAIQIGYGGTIAALVCIVVLSVRFAIENFAVEPTRPWNRSDVPELLHFVIIGITVLVVAVPEGLPLAVTIALAFSVKKMLKDNNLVRHLHACETMGNATSICSDKTGTLTTNRMTVVESYFAGTHYDVTPQADDLPLNLVELVKLNIAVNSNYTSLLMDPVSCVTQHKMSKNSVKFVCDI